MKTNHSKLSSLLFNTDDTKKCLWHFSSPSFMRDYKDICSAGYAVVLFCEYAFQNAKIPGIPSGQKMIFRGWPESHFLFTAPTRCSIVLSSQQAKSSLLSQLYENPDYDAIVKTRKKGFQETAKCGKSLEIPYFKPISVLFYLFRDRRHTVSTWVETMVWMSIVHGNKSYLCVWGNISGLCITLHPGIGSGYSHFMDNCRVVFSFTKKEISTRQGQYLFPLIISHLSSIKATNWNWTKSLRDGLPRLWLQRLFYLKTKRQLKLPWKVFIV